MNKISEIEHELEVLDVNCMSQDTINAIVEKINSVYLESAENAMGSFKTKK